MSTDPLFMRDQSGEYFWYHNDHLGTPQMMTTSSGAVVWKAKYTSFGKADVDPSSTVVNPLRFPGQYEDEELGLHYNLFRYYNPGTGRYLNADPIGLEGGINVYAYVFNNPVNWVDPYGLITIPCECHPEAEALKKAMEAQCQASNRVLNKCWVIVTSWGKHLIATCRPKYPGDDPKKPPDGFEWKGKPGSEPGGPDGNYYNPNSKESLRPDLDHKDPVGPHWDYKDPDGTWFRIHPDGTMTPKKPG